MLMTRCRRLSVLSLLIELLAGYGFILIVVDWIQKWHEDEGTLDT